MLKAGMSTTVRVLNNSSEKSVIIPYKAVTEQLGEFFVYVVGDSSKVSQRKIILGKQIGHNCNCKRWIERRRKDRGAGRSEFEGRCGDYKRSTATRCS